MTSSSEIDIPDELLDKLENFHQAIAKMTQILAPLQELNINSSDLPLDPLDRARLNLASGYALNSLFWMYLNTLGIDPKEHKVKSELERYGSFMQRIKEISDKSKAPVLNKDAAGRFVRSALWEPKDNEDKDPVSRSHIEPATRKSQGSRYKQHSRPYDRNRRRH